MVGWIVRRSRALVQWRAVEVLASLVRTVLLLTLWVQTLTLSATCV
jgi:hypothetical protein